ncbi:hypothetical protein, partial [Macrococcus capreoli]|uniref:hypothetical protein n=1 Tax=Macrococcus capreoli TaxID=2982690 RepID=UPI003EE702C4
EDLKDKKKENLEWLSLFSILIFYIFYNWLPQPLGSYLQILIVGIIPLVIIIRFSDENVEKDLTD